VATQVRVAGAGVFVLGGLLLFAVGLFLIGDRQMAFAKKITVYTELKKITGLQPVSCPFRPSLQRVGHYAVSLTPRAFASNVEADAISSMNPGTRNCSRV
jgi:hypothetical protein